MAGIGFADHAMPLPQLGEDFLGGMDLIDSENITDLLDEIAELQIQGRQPRPDFLELTPKSVVISRVNYCVQVDVGIAYRNFVTELLQLVCKF